MKEIVLTSPLQNYRDGLELICKKLGCRFREQDHPDSSAINLCTPEDACQDPSFASFLGSALDGKQRWNVIYRLDSGGFLVCGDRKIDLFHAILKVLDRPEELIREINISRFDRMYQNFDDFSGGFARAADDFDLELHMIDIVRTGAESFEINTLYDDIPIQIRERQHRSDAYPWWCSYAPGLDMFYASELFKGVHRRSMLENNRRVLLNNARLAKALGLAPIFTTFEPRLIPERFFLHYPELRGARVDYDAYSTVPEYALDPTQPPVQQHYAQMLTQLLRDVPELDMYEIWSQDSNAGFPWSDVLYMRANGPLRLYKKPFHEIVNALLVPLRDAARAVSPNTRIHLNTDWCYSEREKEELVTHLPEGVSVTIGCFTFSEVDNRPALAQRVRQLGQKHVQCIQHGVIHDWKLYGPLVGFPFPRAALENLRQIRSFGVENFTMRGGICSRTFVPDYINNEIAREFKYREIEDVDTFLLRQAQRLVSDPREAKLLNTLWAMCDTAHQLYEEVRGNAQLFWTTSLFVSPRTLFRKMVRPIVPNVPALTFSETRYYKPFAFFSHETDPSWDDISYFNFVQIDSDRKLRTAVEGLEASLLPHLKATLAVIDDFGPLQSDYVRDLKDRIQCMDCILTNEYHQLKAALLTHLYDSETDKAQKALHRAALRETIARELENNSRFIALLDSSPSVLIPTTSGEETVYMYKSPMSQPLKRRQLVMEKHIDDEPKGVDHTRYSGNSDSFKYRG